jgi:hypothetical protein
MPRPPLHSYMQIYEERGLDPVSCVHVIPDGQGVDRDGSQTVVTAEPGEVRHKEEPNESVQYWDVDPSGAKPEPTTE